MTDSELRIKVAELCGWKRQEGEEPKYGGAFIQAGWFSPNGRFTQGVHTDLAFGLPDYPNDLNATHEVVTNMRPDDASRWVGELERIVMFAANPHWARAYHLAQATARQRAEAFVATLTK